MRAPAARAPGLGFEAVRPPAEPSPLRSDVAAFVGPTRRGPIGVPTRVEGWREYIQVFGGLDRELDTTYAIRGYFDNGGQVAWIIRLAAPGATASTATWTATGVAALGDGTFELAAATPGSWSRNARVTFRYRGRTASGTSTVDVSVRTSDETEELRAIPAADLVAQLNARSRLLWIRRTASAPASTPRGFFVDTVSLGQNGAAAPAQLEDYFDAIEMLVDLPEPAIVAFPEVHDLGDTLSSRVVRTAAAAFDPLQDRLVLVDLPRDAPDVRWQVDDILGWVKLVLGRGDDDKTWASRWWRAAALYHPWVRVADPLGGVAAPARDIPPCGHVAGVISKLDRERGPGSTPANTALLDMLDLREDYSNDEQALLNPEGVDLLRCVPSLGFSVWGGRTLDRTTPFVAHRRLLHRLVRAIRRVAEPLVFETNGPVLWFMFVRAVTAVLLDAWRAGALAGTRPEEAFGVVCDATTNPPEEIDAGRCVCNIELAPAVPMEFILIRVALSRDGSLQVLS
ncbi:MAG TPA: phage tail sheath subtilisin-like domain-containing protein [Kofleriaceae bacterium]|nr:phage tail sheath subtilisin-like domain-containing protein [Kofleriaceae bacterium]